MNRANDIRRDDDSVRDLSIGLKDIDYTIKYYFENVIKPTIDDAGTRKPVPVIYGSPEKWKNIQEDGYFRDREGKILAPVIAYKRTAIAKNRMLGNKVDANMPQIYYSQEVMYTQKNKYDQFSKLTNRMPVKTYTNTVMADYVDVTYDVVIWTDYVEQMNEIVEAVLYSEGSFWGEKDKFKFRTKIDSFTNTTDALQDNERTVRTTFSITLYGYIVPDVLVKQLSEKLSPKTYSNAEIVTNITTTTVNVAKSAIRVGPDNATFEFQLDRPNLSAHDFDITINGIQQLPSIITSIETGANNTTTIYLNVAEIGYTLTPADTISVTSRLFSE